MRWRWPRSLKANAKRIMPKTSAYAPIHRTMANAPNPGAKRIPTPKSKESTPITSKSHFIRNRFSEPNTGDDFKHSGEDRPKRNQVQQHDRRNLRPRERQDSSNDSG